jgi:hypothetical protein
MSNGQRGEKHMNDPLNQLVIKSEVYGEERTDLKLIIEPDGTLVMDGCDSGPRVEEAWGDSDYEYWVKVAPQWKDTVLMRLIAERFNTSSEFMEWLKNKGIPYDFDSYP